MKWEKCRIIEKFGLKCALTKILHYLCWYDFQNLYDFVHFQRFFFDRRKMYIFLFIEEKQFQCKHIISTLFTVMGRQW